MNLDEYAEFVNKYNSELRVTYVYEKALREFTKSAMDLVNAWQDLPHELESEVTVDVNYPFNESFDEITYRILIWKEKTEDQIEKWRKENDRKARIN
jgi:hypothetical protein